MRELLIEVLDRTSEQRTERIGRTDTERADFQRLDIPDPFDPGPGLFENLDGTGIELLTVITEGNMPCSTPNSSSSLRICCEMVLCVMKRVLDAREKLPSRPTSTKYFN